MTLILTQILENKKREISLIGDIEPSRKFPAPIRITKTNNLQIIAEIKPKSPSHGSILEGKDLIEVALNYSKFASALSVLTDQEHFGGSLELLSNIKKEVAIPVLRKDFIIDAKQVIETFNNGADLILIIVKIIDYPTLIKVLSKSIELGLQSLIEVFDIVDTTIAKKAIKELHMTPDQYVIGVNNRNIDTFEMFLYNSKDLYSELPQDSIKFSLSGISTEEQKQELQSVGYDGALIGFGLTQNA
jgi:indole-3-glycerol phosphate synthase